MRRLALLALCLVLAGCGGLARGGEDDAGAARVWVTRDRGAQVLHTGRVPAGLTALQALRRVAEVETRYGGRFVQAVDGVEGSGAAGDWFVFVNGLAADRGGAEIRVRRGDVVWWDFRRWQGGEEVRAVVGAFPEPFRHGYDGRVRPAAVRYAPGREAVARRLARVVGARSVRPLGEPVAGGANVLRVLGGAPTFRAEAASPAAPVTFTVAGAAAGRLAARPSLARFRFEGLP